MSGYNTRHTQNSKIQSPQISAKSPGGKSVKSKARVTEPSPTKHPIKTDKDTEIRYVCTVCNNTESIRTARLKLETDLLSDAVTKFEEIKSNISDRASQIETLDLHVQHLLLNRDKFQNYQDRVADIENKCDTIMHEITSLQKHSMAPSSLPTLELSETNVAKICDIVEKTISDTHANVIPATTNENPAPTTVTCEGSTRIADLEKLCSGIAQTITELKSQYSSSPQTTCTDGPPYESTKSPTNKIKISDIENPTKYVVDYKPDFIDENFSNKLVEFLQKDTKFTKLKGRSVASYGEAYPYPGSPPAKATPIPSIIDEIIKKIEEEFPGSNLNSCLITEFAGKSSQIPEHSDDEPIISPESNIFTLTIGSQRTVIFRDLCSGTQKSIQPEQLSLYVMSRASQNLWKHRIDPLCEDNATLRYSFTFRSLSSNNKSSTIILGDSNTKHIKFGDVRGSLGKKIPGRREPVYHIGQIDPTICLGYQSIVVHVAINDMRNSSPGRLPEDPAPSDTDSHLKRLAEKLETIQILCPKASIIVSPALPTKISSLNRRAMSFNVKLIEYVKYSNPNITVLDFESFAPNGHDLGDEFCCFKNKNDRIHLGMIGIRKLANIFIESLT